jgi:hypothetical protein
MHRVNTTFFTKYRQHSGGLSHSIIGELRRLRCAVCPVSVVTAPGPDCRVPEYFSRHGKRGAENRWARVRAVGGIDSYLRQFSVSVACED